MLKSITFENFRVLRDAKLPLGPFTLLVGPNGTGKTTVLQALRILGRQWSPDHAQIVTAGVDSIAKLAFHGRFEGNDILQRFSWLPGRGADENFEPLNTQRDPEIVQRVQAALGHFRQGVHTFSFDAGQIARPAPLSPSPTLGERGENLAAVWDWLRDSHPERFRALQDEIVRLAPDFDSIVFDTVFDQGTCRRLGLRLRSNGHHIMAGELSQGTLLAAAMLTLVHLPEPPLLIGLEEPDHGLHPRLLRDVRDALYRLCYPQQYGESRPPTRVIATTHSPYFVDLFRDHPEEIVIAEKTDDGAVFNPLRDHPNLKEILGDAPLGEAWFSGILGGVPAGT